MTIVHDPALHLIETAPDARPGVDATPGDPTAPTPRAPHGPNLATLAQLRGGGRNPLLSTASRRARASRGCPSAGRG